MVWPCCVYFIVSELVKHFSVSGYLDECDQEYDRKESYRKVHQRNCRLLHQVNFLMLKIIKTDLKFLN